MVTITMMLLSQGWDVKVSCLSDDAKPTECTPPGVFPEKTMPIPNGAKLIEIDTGARFLFDEESSEWAIQPETDEKFAQDVVALKADMQEVEGEVGDLKSAIIAIPDLTEKVKTQYFIHGGTGVETSGYYYNCTDYIDISNSINGTSVFCYCTLASNAGIAFYDANKVFISGVSGKTAEASGYITGTGKRAFVIPPKAKYFRASLDRSVYSSPADFDISFVNLPGVQDDLLQSIRRDEFEEYQSHVGALINIHGTVGIANTQQEIGSFRVINGHKYKLKASVQSGLSYTVYVYFKQESTVIGSIILPNGTTEKEIEITASANGICNVLANPSSSVSTKVNVEIFDESGTIGVLESVTDENTLNIGSLKGYQYNIAFEQGGIGGTGIDFASTTDIRTGFVPLVSWKYHVKINTQNGHAYALFYDSNKTRIPDRNIWNKTTDFDFEIPDDDTAKYIRFQVNYGDSTTILPVDNAVILSIVGIYKDINGIINTTPIVPDYFMSNDYLNGKVTDIIENCVIKSGSSFAFITDIHLEDNSGSSKSVLKYVMDNAPVPFIITGGDIPTAYSAVSGNEKAEVLKDAQEWLEWVTYWGQDRVYQLRGNHDYVKPSRTDNKKYYNMQNGGVHQLVMSKFEMNVHAPNPEMNYYYFDDDNQKIRYVVIDGHTYNSSYPSDVVSWVYQDQLQWIADALLSADGYSVVVISHETYNPTMTGYSSNLEDVGNLVGAFKSKGVFHKTYYEHGDVDADFTNSTAELVCFLSGHSHVDESDVDDNGVLCISTTCDARYGSGRTLGTITESAFDVFSIDTTDKTIKTVRIGAGLDRGWNYETGELLA